MMGPYSFAEYLRILGVAEPRGVKSETELRYCAKQWGTLITHEASGPFWNSQQWKGSH